MLWLSSYIQNWQMTKIDHLPIKHKLLHFTSSTPTIDVEPKKGPKAFFLAYMPLQPLVIPNFLSADSTVCLMRLLMVIGPTPPGTGV